MQPAGTGSGCVHVTRLVLLVQDVSATYDYVQWFWDHVTRGLPVRLRQSWQCGGGSADLPPDAASTVLFWEGESLLSAPPASAEHRKHESESEHSESQYEGDGTQPVVTPAPSVTTGVDADESKFIQGMLSGKTAFGFAYRRYRVTFSLDVSPSVATVIGSGTSVIAQRLFSSMEACIAALATPMEFCSFDGTHAVTHTPEIFVSVIAQGSLPQAYKVLLQGAHLSSQNCSLILLELRRHTDTLESECKAFYARAASSGSSDMAATDEDENSLYSLAHPDRGISSQHLSTTRSHNVATLLAAAAETALQVAVRPQASRRRQRGSVSDSSHSAYLVQHINDGVFALQQLPSDARSSLILITDAVAQLPESCSAYGDLVMLLNREKIPCSIVQVSASDAIEAPFGYVSYTEAMQYVTRSTGGSLVAILDLESSPQRNFDILQLLLVKPYELIQTRAFGHSRQVQSWQDDTCHLSTAQVSSYILDVPVAELLRIRFFEGFQLDYLNGPDTHDNRLVSFRLSWHPDIFIIYDVERISSRLRVSLSIQATTDFLAEYARMRRKRRRPPTLVKSARDFVTALQLADNNFADFHRQLVQLLRTEKFANTERSELEKSKCFWELLQHIDPRVRWHNVELSDSVDLLLIADDTPHVHSNRLRQHHGDHVWKRGDTAQSRKREHERLLAMLSRTAPVLDLDQSAPSGNLNHVVTHEQTSEATEKALAALHFYLCKWATFANAARDVYVRVLRSANSSGFATVHAERQTERFLTLHIAFYAADSDLSRTALQEFRSELRRLTVRESEQLPNTVETLCRPVVSLFQKPVRALLVNYDWNTDSHTRLFRFQSLQPTFPLLRAYLKRARWAWHVPADLRSAALTLMSHARTHIEGFACTNTSPYMAFVKQIALRPPGGLGSVTTTPAVPCVLQYVCYTIPSLDTGFVKLIYEFWMEPQWGNAIADAELDAERDTKRNMNASSREYFDQPSLFGGFCDWIADADLRIVCSLYSFHLLTEHALALRLRKNKAARMVAESVLGQKHASSPTLHLPSFSLESVLSCARTVHTVNFPCMQWNSGVVSGRSRELHRRVAELHANVMLRTLELLVDFVLPNRDVRTVDGFTTLAERKRTIAEDLGVADSRCYGTLVESSDSSRALVLAFVRKVDPLEPKLRAGIEIVIVECSAPANSPPVPPRYPPFGLRAQMHSPEFNVPNVTPFLLHETVLSECTFVTRLLAESILRESERALAMCLYGHVRSSWRAAMHAPCPLLLPEEKGQQDCILEVPAPLLGRVLSMCEERVLAIDVSEYVRIVQQRREAVPASLGMRQTSFHRKLLALLGNAFVPISHIHGFMNSADAVESTHGNLDWGRLEANAVYAYSPLRLPGKLVSGSEARLDDLRDVFGVAFGSDDDDAQVLFGEPSEAGAFAALSDHILSEIPHAGGFSGRKVHLPRTLEHTVAERLLIDNPPPPPSVMDIVLSQSSDRRALLLHGLRHLPTPIDARALGVFTHPFFLRVAYEETDTTHTTVRLEILTLPEISRPSASVDSEGHTSSMSAATHRTIRILESDIASLLSEEILHSLREECVVMAAARTVQTTQPATGLLTADTSATEGFTTDASVGPHAILSKPQDIGSSTLPTADRDLSAHIDRRTLDVVLNHLRRVHKSSVSAFTIPLTLMPDTQAASLFSEELSKSHSLQNSSLDLKRLSLRRFDGGYFVMDRWRDARSSSSSSSHSVASDADETVSSNAVTSPSESETPVPLVTPATVLPFWLVLQLIESNETLRVWFHSSTMSRVEKSGIFSTLRASIRSVCDRANQVALLQQMHERRVVSDLVCPPDTDDSTVQSGVSANLRSQREIKVRHHVFRPGQFACPLVHRMVLPLHARLSVQEALAVLGGSILDPFSVAGRRNIFVIREKAGNVFYMRVFGTETASEFSEYNTLSRDHAAAEQVDSGSIQSEGDRNESSRVGRDPISEPNAFTRAVIVEVFGVDRPGVEITHQLRSLIASKLSAVTLASLGGLLERNPLFKLTASDIAFIRGPYEYANKTLAFSLPAFIGDQFFAFLRQSFLKAIGSQLHRETNPVDALPEYWREYADDFFVCTRPTEGVALMLMIHTPPSKKSERLSAARSWLHTFPAILPTEDAEERTSHASLQSEPESGRDLPNDDALARRTIQGLVLASSEGEEDGHSEERHLLEFSLWGREEFVQFTEITRAITACVNHAMSDYAIECWLEIGNVDGHLQNFESSWLNSVSEIVRRSLALGAPTFREIVLSLDDLPAWSVNTFVHELRGCVERINLELRPVCFLLRDDKVSRDEAAAKANLAKPSKKKKKRKPRVDVYKRLTRSEPLVNTSLSFEQISEDQMTLFNSQIQVPWWDLLTRRSDFEFAVVGGCVPQSGKQPVDQSSPIGSGVMYFNAGVDGNKKHCDVSRSVFVSIVLAASRLTVRLYNWQPSASDKLLEHISELKQWNAVRQRALQCMLFQKLGLFMLEIPSMIVPHAIAIALGVEANHDREARISNPAMQGTRAALQRQQQVLALMRNQKQHLGPTAVRARVRQDDMRVDFGIENMKQIILSTSAQFTPNDRARQHHIQLLRTRRLWLPPFSLILARSIAHHSVASGVLPRIGPEQSDPVSSHGEQILDCAFSQARNTREIEREAHVLQNWLLSCQSPLRRSHRQHHEHFRYVLRASILRWDVCVPWILLQDRRVDFQSIAGLFLEKFEADCGHSLGLHRIVLNTDSAESLSLNLQRFHAGGLVILCVSFHSQQVSEKSFAVFVRFRMFTLETSLISSHGQDGQLEPLADPTSISRHLFAYFRRGPAYSNRKTLLETVRNYSCSSRSRSIEPADPAHLQRAKIEQERRLGADAARFLRVIGVRAAVFDFHLISTFNALMPGDTSFPAIRTPLVDSSAVLNFGECVRVLCAIADIFPEFCAAQTVTSVIPTVRTPDTRLLSVSMEVAMNPAKVASPQEMFQFLSLNSARYGVSNVRGADAIIIPPKTVQMAVEASDARMGCITRIEDQRIMVVLLPEYDRSRLQRYDDKLRLHVFVLQVPRDSRRPVATVDGALVQIIVSLYEWLGATLHRALMHFQRELLFSKLLATKPAMAAGSAAVESTPSVLPIGSHQVPPDILSAKTSDLLHGVEPLTALSSVWSPQIIRTRSVSGRGSDNVARALDFPPDLEIQSSRRVGAALGGLTENEFDTLISLSVSVGADVLDPTLRDLFGKSKEFAWRPLLVKLLRAYGVMHARELSWRRDEHHFIIMNTISGDSTFFIHLEFRGDDNTVAAYSCSLQHPDEFVRDPVRGSFGSMTRFEMDRRLREQMQGLVNRVLFLLWKRSI